jgi:hypothetical protein
VNLLKGLKQVLGGGAALVLICIASSCAFIRLATSPHGDGSDAPASFTDSRAEDRYTEWCQTLPNYIIPRMCDYYQLHPERFKPTGQGEEITIEGFAAFVKSDGYFKSGNHCYIVNGTIFDPWGQPLHFVQDLNMDGYIEAVNERRPVLNLGTSGVNHEHHFGICKQSPFKGPFGQPSERVFAATY